MSKQIAAHASDNMRAIVRHLEANPGPHVVRDIVEATSIKYGTVKVYLRRCVYYGWLSNPSRGTYEAYECAPPVAFDATTPVRHGSDNYPSPPLL
jgi:hypothetical protein